jgi:ABC-type polysaccharide/polyol phosphate transport system, ATPase component
MAATVSKPISSQETAAGIHVSLENVGVRYLLVPENRRTIKGRVLGLFGSPSVSSEFWALRNFSLSVNPGEIVGIVGPNGSGKSTALRVIAGIIEPTTGTVNIRGRVNPLLELGAAFNHELTGRENAYLYGSIYRISRKEMDELIPQIAAFAELGVFFDAPIKTYSSGMVARLAFAISTQIQPEILLLDEVLSVGDEQFQRKSFFRIKKLISRGAIVFIVSHGMGHIQQLCNRVIYLSKGRIVADGKPSQVLAQYQRDAAAGR